MDATEETPSTVRFVATVMWEGVAKNHGRNYGFWTPKDDGSHLDEIRDFINDRHGKAYGLEVNLFAVEDVTGTFEAAHLPGHVEKPTTLDELKISFVANSIGYALQEAGTTLDVELVMKAAERLAEQGLLK